MLEYNNTEDQGMEGSATQVLFQSDWTLREIILKGLLNLYHDVVGTFKKDFILIAVLQSVSYISSFQ